MSVITSQHRIKAGILKLSLHQGGERLGELMAFGSRLNPRRGYLFVSRVLGKHIPVRPQKMDAIHAELASAIELLDSSAYVVGMAETAIGLGAGVARHLAGLHGYSVFHHTTRFQVTQPWLRIREAHSHADTMHMARLGSDAMEAIADIQDLVLVDDEISTGMTSAHLATQLTRQTELGHIKRLHIVSLVNWLSDSARQQLLQQLPEGIEVHLVQLMAGHFHFVPCASHRPQLPDNVDTDFCNVLLNARHAPLPIESEGLYGKLMTSSFESPPEALLSAARATQGPLTILGMGEYLDAPFRLALELQRQGRDILFQSSTRSPIAIGDTIASRIEHDAPGAPGKRHFLYNAATTHSALAFDGIGQPSLSRQLEKSHLAMSAMEATA